MTKRAPTQLPDDALWYKDAVIYELRVRSFYDSNGDGVGDFPGLTQKLDYLADLGVTALWLLPFYPSSLKDDGYDISDYTDVHPDCGTLNDFKTFLREAHRRGLRVITELVVNHTSDQHPWFQRARRAPAGSKERDFYVWSDTPERYREARIIFKDFEPSNWSWDPVAHAYYWHRFYAHQPDLNFENPAVHRAMFQVTDFWFGLGVDGLRLDAVPYLYERDGTSCENLAETHVFLKALRAHVDRRWKNRMLLAEANQWPEDAVAYFGEGTECHMAFHFPIMPRLFMGVRREDRFPITDIWAQTPAIHESCQWALFLRNHDELTLEMVTDEERDYMYRVYAQDQRMRINLGIRRRLAPLLSANRRTVELMNGLLFSLPGTPVLYYGDELGMGDNVYLGDRDGVRTPMQWSGDRNAGFSVSNPQRLILPVIIDPEYHYTTCNVEAQEQNRHSMLWWMRRLIALRKGHRAFGRGTIEFLAPRNPKVLAFIRQSGDERILVVANLSRSVQFAELDLSAHRGLQPVELFGRTSFPRIGEAPYLMTFAPHAFYWFSLEPPPGSKGYVQVLEVPGRPEVPRVAVPSVARLLEQDPAGGETRQLCERLLVQYLPGCRWFLGHGRELREVHVREAIPLDDPASVATTDGAAPELPGGGWLVLLEAEYADADPETYVLGLGWVLGEVPAALRQQGMVVADVEDSGGIRAALCEQLAGRETCRALMDVVDRRRHQRGLQGELLGWQAPGYRASRDLVANADPRPMRAEHSNAPVAFGDRYLLKLARRLDESVNPEMEVLRWLGKRGFPHVPELLGGLEYRADVAGAEKRSVGLLQAFVPHQADAWGLTADELKRFYENAVAQGAALPPPPDRPPLALLDQPLPDLVRDLLGAYRSDVELLGRRTAELHLALMGEEGDPVFGPEPYTMLYQRSLYQSMRNLVGHHFRQLREALGQLPPDVAALGQAVEQRVPEILGHTEFLLVRRLAARRQRCHGHLHLGQVLHTGKDFVFIDFEGEPGRPLADRRRKRSPLRDVAGLIRSFEYAAESVLAEQLRGGGLGERSLERAQPLSRLWQAWVVRSFLHAYLAAAEEVGPGRSADLIPDDPVERTLLLRAFLFERAVQELGWELAHRPGWVRIPLLAIQRLLDQAAAEGP